MPPEVKPVISSLAEMTCENCVFYCSTEKDVCHNTNAQDWFTQPINFCSQGTWRLVIAQNRVSLGCFEVCYDYLTEAE